MTMPNFLIIGAAKSATTSLYEYLNQHPDIFMSRNKEPRFFALVDHPNRDRWLGRDLDDDPVWKGSIVNIDDYRALFDEVDGQVAIGEASPLYLAWSSHAAPAIQRHIPDAKLIACLRDPAERAFSHYCHNLLYGSEHRGPGSRMRSIARRGWPTSSPGSIIEG